MGTQKVKLNKKGQQVLLVAGTVFVMLIIIVAAAVKSNNREVEETTTESSYVAVWTSMPEGTAPFEAKTAAAGVFNDIYSEKAVLIHLDSGEVLAEKNAYDRGQPASITKVMTTIIAIENIPDLDATYTMPIEIFNEIYGQDLSSAGLVNGETLTIRDILYGLFLRSGAECCLAIENIVSGDSESFVALMNAKAEELGLNDTHFANSTGDTDENHYTTVYDMAILLRYCLQNETFREIASTSEYTVAPTNKHADGLTFNSTLSQSLPIMSDYEGLFTIEGGKTGHTDTAGRCLITFAEINGEEYILCTFGAYNFDGQPTTNLHTRDHCNVYSAFSKSILGIED